ncbi:ligand-binding sensor domain-containing protein [Flavobacterium sp.]|uniref:ligand-binding sensor domain-containing protein n=1 Tax=Flavobacterium sp. TaxID=239 RepID=UPI003D6AF351
MKLKHALFILLFVHYFSVKAQEFKNFTTEEGLPSNEVYGVFQDKNGAMWFSTDRGLCQYNGYEFKKYEPKDGLTDITVFDFYPQENGQVWCSTFNKKIFYFENGSNRFVPYKYNHLVDSILNKYGKISFYIKSLAVAKNGTLYLSNGDWLFSISVTGKITEISKPILNRNQRIKESALITYLHSFVANNKQRVYFRSNKKASPILLPSKQGVYRNTVCLQPGCHLLVTENLVEILRANAPSIKITNGDAQPISGGKLDKDHFWIGYRSNGLKIFDFSGKCIARFLPHATITNVAKDCYGGLWVTTTDYGVYYADPNQVRTLKMENKVVNSLTKDNNQNLYIGTYNGDIYKKEKKGPVVKIKKATASFPAFAQFYEDKNEVVFSHNGKLLLGNTLKDNNYIQVTKISDDNPSVLSLIQYGVITIWEKNKVFSDTMIFRIHDISHVGRKNYLATMDGLKILEGGKIYRKKGPLFNYRIDDIDYTPYNGVLYAATLGKGVVVYNTLKNSVYAIDKAKGLSSDIVTEVYVENSNTIWACTNYGLNRIRFSSPTTYKVDYLTTANGLLSNQIKDLEVIGDSIYIGTAKGLSVISKEKYAALLSERNYFLRLKDIYINNTSYLGNRRKMQLSPSENQIDFVAEAVSFSGKKAIAYRYKMEGLDKGWKTTGERKFSYAYMPPGDYTLRVKVMEDGRDFSKECIVLPIHIDKPFWKTFWFLGFMTLAVGAIIYFFFKIRVLSYNKDIVRELLRLLLKRIKMKDNYFTFKESGKDIRVRTSEILFVRSSGNYIDIATVAKTYTVRGKIGDFLSLVQDPLEFLRIHRSYIVRIDKVEQKSRKAVYIQQEEIPVGETYLPELDKIVF